MVRTADPPHAAGGLDPHGQGHLCSHPVALDHLSIGTRGPGGYPTSLSAAVHPVGRAAGSSGGRHWPPYHAYSLNQRECYGAYDPIDHRPPPFDGHPPDHRDRARGAGGFSASMPPPPAHRPAGYDVDSPSVVPAPDRHMISSGASSGRPLRPRRESDISPVPSALIRSTQGEGYREHQHHRARDESGHSPRFHSPLRGSKSVPLPERHRSEDGRKGSKSLPSAKRYRFEDGRKGSPSGRHWYDDGERCGSRGRYADGRHTQEMAYPSSCDQGLHNLGDSKRNLSPHDHGESVQHHLSLRVNPPSPMPMEMSPWDDGYKSPTSPTYRCEDVEQGSRDEDKNETPGWLDSDYDASGISGRDSNFKIEDPVLKTKEDSAYTELVDDFMDAVMKSWRDPNPNIRVDKEADQKLADSRFAELALKRYNKNKNNKVKYALIEAIADAVMFEASGLYRHVNFYAKAKNGPKKNDGKVLVFAELHQIGYRPNAMALTCFRLLDENNQLCGRRDQIRSCHMIQDQDKGHCYACSDRIKHPDGSCYKAGILHFHRGRARRTVALSSQRRRSRRGWQLAPQNPPLPGRAPESSQPCPPRRRHSDPSTAVPHICRRICSSGLLLRLGAEAAATRVSLLICGLLGPRLLRSSRFPPTQAERLTAAYRRTPAAAATESELQELGISHRGRPQVGQPFRGVKPLSRRCRSIIHL